MRFFNTAGPVRCDEHYCLPPLERFDLSHILSLIEQKKYFILHAPRQTGKTSTLLALMDNLNQDEHYHCLYINAEMGQSARENVKRGVRAILSEMGTRAKDYLGLDELNEVWPALLEKHGEDAAINQAFTVMAQTSAKPLVLLIDEIDSLVGDTLIAVLRQLRAGYDKRPGSFPQSVVLCGVRDIRDYRIHSSQMKEIITGGSAFNIKAESLRLGNFSQAEVKRLYQQHTDETEQVFEEDALALAWELTQGQPWLVNALAYENCFKMEAGQERANPITAEMITEAKERLILHRETHLDQLADKLQETRVRRVIEPILSGISSPDLIPTDDIQYVQDLGLIRIDEGQLALANPIYQEVIPRELTYSTQLTIAQQPAWYIASDGRLDMEKLLTAFQQFFREHSKSWVERFDYKEAGPQLLMQAFLQRIINSGGRVEREYGLGRGRTDLLAIWPVDGGEQRVVVELKLLHRSLEKTVAPGLEQTWAYMDQSGAEAGHLVIFDRDETRSWDEKIFSREEEYQGTTIKVWGM
ncbi:MAG: ATP-binding protein [Chloroflexi bacterium]|nr:ATP-binding protein [Chloroflexota bacterium]